MLIKLPIWFQSKSELVLVLFNKKVAVEVYVEKKKYSDFVISKLNDVGFYAKFSRNFNDGVMLAVSKTRGRVEKLVGIMNSKDNNFDDLKLGYLSGYPETAIKAYLNRSNNKILDGDMNIELLNMLPHTLSGFVFSKDNFQKELLILLDWHQIIIDKAPEILQEMYSKEEIKEYAKKIKKLIIKYSS